MNLRVGALLLACFALVPASCGDDDEDKRAERPTGNVQRYCDLLRQLDRAGTQFFRRLEEENASHKEFEAAEKEFVEQHEADLRALQRAAPESIRNDTRTVLDAQRARAGLTPPVNQRRAEAAEKRIRAFERRHCG
jgi:hypothetical protein